MAERPDVAAGGPVLHKRSEKGHYRHEAPWLPHGCTSPAGVPFSLLFAFFEVSVPEVFPLPLTYVI